MNPYSDIFEYVVVTVRLLDTISREAPPLIGEANVMGGGEYNETMSEVIPPSSVQPVNTDTITSQSIYDDSPWTSVQPMTAVSFGTRCHTISLV